ncbi:MAG: ATP-binding protein [Nitrospirota bacterium]
MDTRVLKESLYFYNPWWGTGKVPLDLLKAYQRPILKTLVSYLGLDRIIVLKGPRRTGKTTLFYQIIDYLLKEGVIPTNIIFLSYDDIEVRVDVDKIFKAYQEINKRLIKEGELIYVFMDEVHFLENWQLYVKKYFDRKYPLKFLVSGSAATLIKRATESLAGRTIEETIYPFSFYEFLSYKFKNQKAIQVIDDLRKAFTPFKLIDITNLIPYIPEIRIIFEEYLEKGGFPNLFVISEKLLWKRLVREDIVEKVIYRDLVELYGIKKPEVLERLFLYLADITGQILSVVNIANSFKLSREYTEKYLVYLEQSVLIKRLRKYAKSVEGIIRSSEKIHLLDSGLINAFSNVEIGRVLESLVASHLLRDREKKIYYFREKYEVDLVTDVDKKIFPIEVKYKDNIQKRDLSGIYSFSRKFKSDTLIVVTPDLLKEETLNGRKIIYIPAWLFLLLFG